MEDNFEVNIVVPIVELVSDLNKVTHHYADNVDSITFVFNGVLSYLQECVNSPYFFDIDPPHNGEYELSVICINKVSTVDENNLSFKITCQVNKNSELTTYEDDETELDIQGSINASISRWKTSGTDDINQLSQDLVKSVMEVIERPSDE